MLRQFRGFAVGLVLTATGLFLLAGCGNPTVNQPKPTQAATKSDDDHDHAPGAHGGTIVEIGRDNYHAEVVFEKGGTLRLYTLGRDETKVQEVEIQELEAYAKLVGGTESINFTLKPQPQPGDAEGKTSLFVGQLPAELRGQRIEVTIPSIRFNGERFRVGFQSSAESAHGDAMPAGVEGEEARELYLTPGGLYTQTDIDANGRKTAAEKFRGVPSKHDFKPRPGDKICPITLTKANPNFTWVVGGKDYEFCCPPCIDEFLVLAREQPDEVKEPDEYVKRD